MVPQHCITYSDVLYGLFLQKCTFSQAQCKLPEDGPNGPKRVGVNIKDILM